MGLNDYLKLNSNAIVDLVNKKHVPVAAEITKEPIFNELAGLLMGKFIHQPDGKRNQAHNVLAMIMIYSMWCGWLSQTKANRGGYPQEWVDSFKRLIVEAFEVGQKYSNQQP